MNAEAILMDLITRTEAATRKVAQLVVDTGITFKVSDIVQAVEDDLPPGYPAPTAGPQSRRDFIAEVAQGVVSGSLYED